MCCKRIQVEQLPSPVAREAMPVSCQEHLDPTFHECVLCGMYLHECVSISTCSAGASRGRSRTFLYLGRIHLAVLIGRLRNEFALLARSGLPLSEPLHFIGVSGLRFELL